MPQEKKLIDDMLALGGNLLGNMLGARHEMKAQAKARFDDLARRLDIVSRSEFDAAFAMLAKARDMQESLSHRLSAIEKKLNMSSDVTPPKSKKSRLPSVKKGNQSPTRRKA